jgi:hypothetical protein
LFATDLIGSCSDSFVETDYIFTTGVSSIYDNDEFSYQLYPNPSPNKITIQTESSLNHQFMIYDQQGREIKKGFLSGTHTEVSLENLASGTYTVHIEGDFKPRVLIKR